MDEVKKKIIMSAAQCRMARAAIGWGVRDLARRAGVAIETVVRLERGERLKPITITKIQAAIDAAGVMFIAKNGGGEGVRLKK
jgi:transcriptional regulator with XRE-family HTH domain